MTDAEPWTCPTCNVVVCTHFCPTCGERRLRSRDLTLRGLFEQAFQAFTSFDIRLLRSVRRLVERPGELTVLYLEGSRKPYVGPFALFLLANVLFVAMESLTNSNVFSTTLSMHLQSQAWSPLARRWVSQHLATAHTTLERYAPVFDHAVADNAKSLVILMVLPFALLPAMAFRASARPFIAHVVFSLHFHAFMLLLLSVALLIPAIDLLFGGAGLASRILDNAIAIALMLCCAVYLFLAIGKVYGGARTAHLVKTTLLIVAATCIFMGYRFLLLVITLNST
jgi:Protein of unknown function (DUF3667)